jgi:TolA-binding protein
LVGILAKHPEKLENPFTLGEVLYYSGHLKEAAIFYQEALKRRSADKTASGRDKAWIIFQIGNCLRSDDLPTAKKMYGILIAEYSDSPWVDLARAREGLIDWQQKDKPLTLIAESKL